MYGLTGTHMQPVAKAARSAGVTPYVAAFGSTASVQSADTLTKYSGVV